MKIKLIAPARKPEYGEDFWDIGTAVRLHGKKTGGPYLSLYILAALTPDNVEVAITDERIEQINFNERVDLVGITVVTSLANRAYEIADEYRKRGIPVILGGIHVSLLPEEAIQHCDSVVIGEAEELWGQVVEDFQKGKLERFYRASAFPELTQSPIPKWDFLEPKAYSYFTLQIGRGCPFDCDFCMVKRFNGRVYRHKEIERVISEIKLLKKLDPEKLIFFTDDNILAIPPFTKELLSRLIPLKMKAWWCQSSVNRLKDDRMLDLMYQAGCRVIFVGIESVSQKSIDSMNKGAVNKVDEYKDVIRKVHSHKMAVFGSFVFGNDTDDKTIFEETIKFIDETNIGFAMINILTPPPGSRLFTRLEQENRIFHWEWWRYNTDTVCFQPKQMTPDQLYAGRHRVLNQIYSYDSLYKRWDALWSQGVLCRQKKGFFAFCTKGRLLFTLLSLCSTDFKRMRFILRSLWNKNLSSVASVDLGLSFHDYAYRFINKAHSKGLKSSFSSIS
ncbi:MAG: radical SAM protein [Elusimicrobiota bacterium]